MKKSIKWSIYLLFAILAIFGSTKTSYASIIASQTVATDLMVYPPDRYTPEFTVTGSTTATFLSFYGNPPFTGATVFATLIKNGVPQNCNTVAQTVDDDDIPNFFPIITFTPDPDCELGAGNTYKFLIQSNGGHADTRGNGTDAYFTLYDEGGGSIEDYTTHFISIEPVGGSTVATGSAFYLGSEFFVASEQYTEGEYLRFKWVRNQDLQASVANSDLIWTTYDFPTSDWTVYEGYNNFATTTEIDRIGQYTFVIELRKESLVQSIVSWWGLDGLFSNGSVIMSTTTQFIVGQRLSYDTFIASSTELGQNFFSSSTLSISDVKNYCSFSTNFSIIDCLYSLFVPTYNKVDNSFHLAQSGFFSHAPFGYVTRLVFIFNNTSTSSLPVFTIPIRTGLNTTTDTIYLTYDMNDIISGAGNVIDNTRDPYYNKNLKDIFYDIVRLIVALAVIIVIIKDMTGSHKHESDLPKGRKI